MRLKTILVALLFITGAAKAQIPDHIYAPNVKTVRLHKYADQTSYPVIQLGSNEQLEFHFDDLDADVKMYYYTFELRNADWTQTLLRPFEYIKGFQTARITNYRNSFIAFTRYTHYYGSFPDRTIYPSRSGNYLFKVFLDGDTSKVVFTKRFLVVETKSVVNAQLLQPFNAEFFRTHQRLHIGVTTDTKLNVFGPQDLIVVGMQNFSWTTSKYFNRPNIYRGNYFEYSDETQTSFPSGREWRWIDLRSLRLMSDRMQRIDKKRDSTIVYVKPDGSRASQVYLYYRDLNGLYTVETSENLNPYWQGDYAEVNFSYFPDGNRELPGRSLHLYGELTNFLPDDSSRMIFNAERGAYEKKLFLKQGFYNYTYITMADNPNDRVITLENTEGNYWGTENAYMVMVYYRPFGGRADELIGFMRLNSVFERPGN